MEDSGLNERAEFNPEPIGLPLPIRMLRWLLGRIGLRTILIWALLLTALSSTAYGVASLLPDLEAGGLLFSASILGLLAGWLLARYRLPGWSAVVISAGIGFLWIFGQVGQLFVPLGQVGVEGWRLAVRTLSLQFGQPFPSVDSLIQALATLAAKTVTLLDRVRAWLAGLNNNGSVSQSATFDPVAALLVWCLALWGVSVWAAWAVRRRRQSLAAMLPAAAVLGSSLAFTGTSSAYLLPLLAATLFLLAWMGYEQREQHWRINGVDYSEDVHFDIGIAVFGVVVGLTALAALAPSLTIHSLSDFVQTFRPPIERSGPSIGRSLGLSPAATPQPVTAINTHIAGGLPRSHLLGTGPELSKEVVMIVRTGEIPPGPPESVPKDRQPPQYYWRSITYDRYTGTGWSTSPSYIQSYPPNAAIEPGKAPSGLRLLHQDIQMIDPSLASGGGPDGARISKSTQAGSLLYTAGEPRSVDTDLQAAWRTIPAAGDPARGDLFGALLQANHYRAESWVATASAEQLRTSGLNYPAWVRERYLGLPESVPARVRALARDLTATEATPYDRAKAIETYLRAFPYALDIPLPPINRDVVDYFLFDLKKGYCDYYASAMVVLARAAGIPARLVMGYASGTYDALNARYVVTEAEAHSWPEVYFIGYGWIEFEPTGSRPIPAWTGETLPSNLPAATPVPETFSPKIDWKRLLGWAGVTIGLLILAVLLLELIMFFRLVFLRPGAAIGVLYRQLYQSGRRLSIQSHAGDTPDEFTRSLTNRLADLSQHPGWWVKLLGPAASQIRWLADCYARAVYSQRPPGIVEQRQAIRVWVQLRWRLWLAVFWRSR